MSAHGVCNDCGGHNCDPAKCDRDRCDCVGTPADPTPPEAMSLCSVWCVLGIAHDGSEYLWKAFSKKDEADTVQHKYGRHGWKTGEFVALAELDRLRSALAEAEKMVADLHAAVGRGDHGDVKTNHGCALSGITDLRIAIGESDQETTRLERELDAATTEVERMRPVVEAARAFVSKWAHAGDGGFPTDECCAMCAALDAAEKGGGG